ncbi:sugar transporter [Thermaurantimonas aggregans]|uniref:Sugar transporter n=1 Tax=Thermaurantimonas aggregans TaxID=2173829 RepID=A0A401XNP0_9FLAO|nr:polysaccharide biosynthesis tyrosine autokinase [Thermaurantimonas aggregans]MCX8147687.1 polysaccharide biosynthesis tyrosine autokinase [Thermaurantimonas aggregans]GCD78627.1 sugar transporter [Thermaurantimonas aggregans]
MSVYNYQKDPDLFEDPEQELSFSINELYSKLFRYWKLFVFSLLVGISVGIFTYFYTTPKYEAKAMLLLNVEDDGSNAFKSLQELVSSYNPRLMYENEVVVMKSNNLCLRTIKSYDYEVSYFKPNFFKRSDITFSSPIQVIFDDEKWQLLNTEFILYNVDEFSQTYRLKIKKPSGNLYNYTTQEKMIVTEIKNEIDKFNNSNKKYIFGQWIESPFFRFRIEKKPGIEIDSDIIFTFNHPHDLALKLSNNLKFSPTAKESSGVDITIQFDTPEKTQFLLKKHIEEYQKLGKEIKTENITKTLNFINEQLVNLQDSLRTLEAKIQRMRASNLLINTAEQGVQFLIKLQELDKRDFELRMIEKYLRSLISSSDGSDYGISTVPQASGINDPVLLSLINQLNQLKIQRRKLGDMSDNNPIIRQINEQIKSTLQLIRLNAETLLKNNNEELIQNAAKIREIENKIAEIPGLELGMISIERNYKIIENIYNFFLYKKSELEINLNFNKSGILFIDYYTFEPVKKSPKLILNAAIGGAFLFSLSFFIVFFKIVTKNTIDEVTNFKIFNHINFIAQIPHSSHPDPNVVGNHPQSIVSESFRILRSKIPFYKNPDEGCITILITSFIPGEGKSFVSLNLAILLALGGKKVLLIGGDMRKPKLYDELKVKNDVGLSTFLSGHSTLDEAIRFTFINNLFFLSAGPIPPNPSELLITKKFAELMSLVKEQFEYIVIDSPPILAVNDANEIMNYSDINFMVARKNITQVSFLKNLEYNLMKNQLKNVGVILNDFDALDVIYGLGSQAKGYGYIKE